MTAELVAHTILVRHSLLRSVFCNSSFRLERCFGPSSCEEVLLLLLIHVNSEATAWLALRRYVGIQMRKEVQWQMKRPRPSITLRWSPVQ